MGSAGTAVASRHPAAARARPNDEATIASSVIWSPDSSATTRPAAHDDDPVGEPEDLLDLVRDQQDRDAARGQVDDQLVEVALRADVDAARRIVGEEDGGLGEQRAGEHQLLLVAAGQGRGRRLEGARRRDARQRVADPLGLRAGAGRSRTGRASGGWPG